MYSFCLHSVKWQNNSISNNSIEHKYTVSMSKTVLFQEIQFCTSTQLSSIRSIDRMFKGTTFLH